MRFRFQLCMFCLFLLSWMISNQASASLIVVSYSLTNPNPLLVGETGTVDVFARSLDGTQSLDGFALQVKITPTNGAPIDGLIFTSSQSESQLGIGGPNGYVFIGNSVSENLQAPIGAVSDDGSEYTGFDATFDGTPFELTTTNRLIYRLDLTAMAVGTYSIAANLFDDSFFANQLDTSGSAIAAVTTGSTLKIVATPEPSSVLLLTLAASGMGIYRRRRRQAPRM